MISNTALAFSCLTFVIGATAQGVSASTSTSVNSDQPFNFGDPTVTSGASVPPTGSPLAITFPGGIDDQVLVGSLLGTASGLTTVAITCPDYVNAYSCGFNPAITVTAGSSTIQFALEYYSLYSLDQHCSFSAGGGTCTLSETGSAEDILTATSGLNSAALSSIITTTTTIVFDASDIQTAQIIITGGATGGSGSGTTAKSTSGGSSRTGSGTTSHTGTASASSSASRSSSGSSTASTAASNDVRALAPGVAFAGVMGLAALLL